jgi:hypothetical protein
LTDEAKIVVRNRSLLYYCGEDPDLEGLICAEGVNDANR